MPRCGRYILYNLIATTAADNLSVFTGMPEQNIGHPGHLRTVCQPESVRLFQLRGIECIIRSPEAINLLVAIANQNYSAGLAEDESTGYRVGILRFVKKNGVPFSDEIRIGELKKLQINIMRDRKIRFSATHCMPEYLHCRQNFVR